MHVIGARLLFASAVIGLGDYFGFTTPLQKFYEATLMNFNK